MPPSNGQGRVKLVDDARSRVIAFISRVIAFIRLSFVVVGWDLRACERRPTNSKILDFKLKMVGRRGL